VTTSGYRESGTSGTKLILRARALFLGPKGNGEVDQQVRKTLVDSLYSNPMNLVIGAVCGAGVCLAAAWATDDGAMELAAWGVSVIAILRIAIMVAVRHTSQANTRALELLFEAGAFAYSAALSALVALAVLRDVTVEAEIALMVYAVGYATGIAPRNAGRPFIAVGQLCIVLAPLTVVLLFHDAPLMRVLGVVCLLHIPATVSITFRVHRTLRNSIAAADASAQMAEKMGELARTDVVTGLTNRAGLNHDAAEMLTRLPADRKLAMFWIDLDRFKEINDTLGHPVGDKVLAEVANRLRVAAPESAVIARFGGDEFIIVAEVGDRGESERIARALVEEISRPARIDGHRIDTAASMGVELLRDDGLDMDALMQGADLALYHAKVGGKNQVCFFDTAMTRDLVRKKEIEAELRAAIQRDELSIFFQPIVDLETGRIRTFEALVRWFHPEKGELRPDEFIPVAEDTGVIITLGNWITAQAAKAAAGWPEDVTIAVNLSPVQIRAPGARRGSLTRRAEGTSTRAGLSLR
jgi:diguanylate cyclase (GGDEF)-like protein